MRGLDGAVGVLGVAARHESPGSGGEGVEALEVLARRRLDELAVDVHVELLEGVRYGHRACHVVHSPVGRGWIRGSAAGGLNVIPRQHGTDGRSIRPRRHPAGMGRGWILRRNRGVDETIAAVAAARAWSSVREVAGEDACSAGVARMVRARGVHPIWSLPSSALSNSDSRAGVVSVDRGSSPTRDRREPSEPAGAPRPPGRRSRPACAGYADSGPKLQYPPHHAVEARVSPRPEIAREVGRHSVLDGRAG